MDRESVDAKTLREWLARGEEVTVVDVRRAEDHAEWSVPGSVNLAAYDKLKAGEPDAMEGLDVPAGVPVVTVCGAGRSSAVAAEQLRERGFDALTLEGGMKAWSLAWNTAEVHVEGSEAEVVQVRRTGKGCLSYLIGSGGEAAVIRGHPEGRRARARPRRRGPACGPGSTASRSTDLHERRAETRRRNASFPRELPTMSCPFRVAAKGCETVRTGPETAFAYLAFLTHDKVSVSVV